MARSTKDSWLNSHGDIREAEVHDVPIPGESVLVRGLSAKYSADVMSQLRMVQQGESQEAKLDIAKMERLQFLHGVVDPQFTEPEVEQIQEKFGPAFNKVVERVRELSGIDQEAITETEQRFPVGGTRPTGDANGVAGGVRGPDLPVRTG